MANRFASGKNSIAECDRCGQRYMLKQLKIEIIKTKPYNLKVCPECWDPDQPQLQLGMYPVDDPQAVREPRIDTSYYTSGLYSDGYPAGGSRDIQWGWRPIGGSSSFDSKLTPNNLVSTTSTGTVSISNVFVPPPVTTIFIVTEAGLNVATEAGSIFITG